MKYLCHATRWMVLTSAALTLLQSVVSSQSILSVTGHEQSFGWVVIFNGQGYAASWTQDSTYSNVTVSATLTSFGVPDQTGRAYLTRRLGPGTTTNDEVASAEFTFPAGVADVPLFTGLTLPPGRYYLSMIGNDASGSAWMSGCPAKIDTADGVMLGNDFGFYGVVPYLPASGIAENSNISMRFKVFTPTNSIPSSPISFQANLRAYTTSAEILLTWETLAGADHYEVYRAGEDARWQLVTSDARSNQYRDGGYWWFPTYYHIIAVNAAGVRYLSETVSVPPLQRLIDLTGISVRPLTETSVSIDWEVNSPLRNFSGPAGTPARVLVEVGPSPSALSTVEWTSTFAQYGQQILGGLAPDTAYWYRLTFTAPNDCGFSYLNQFTTRSPTSPAHVVVNVSDGFPMLVTDEDTPITFTLAADEPRDPPWTFAITVQPMHGNITGTGPDFLYTPAPDWDGFDLFWYSASSGTETISGVVNVMLIPVNDAPVALEPLAAFAEEDLSIPLPLEGRELDSSGSVTGFVIVSGPDHGTFENGFYTPAPHFNGIDRLTYRASDGMAEGNVATVRIRVESINDPPIAGPQTVTAYENTPQAIVLAAADPDNALLSMFINTPPLHGTLGARGIEFYDVTRCHAVSELIYTPAPGFTGEDRFDYMVNDGSYSAAGSVVIQVVSPNRPPVGVAQSLTTEFGVPVMIQLSGSDPDGDSLTYSVATNPAHGSLSGSLPSILYMPAAGYSGSDAFSFRVHDGRTSSVPATVTIVVLSENAPPLAPFGLVATAVSDHRVKLQWTDGSSFEKGFRIERSVEGGAFKQIGSVNDNVTEYIDGGTQANKVYSYRVRAYNKNGNSDYSNVVSVTALP